MTLPALMLAGLSPFQANITSTVALFPAQVTSGLAGRDRIAGVKGLPFRVLAGISLMGGGTGALLLLATPPLVFAHLLPWLVLFATSLFAWGAFRDVPQEGHKPAWLLALSQFGIATYGGYFGGGIGFLMLAALTLAGQMTRTALATKNLLAAMINAVAVALFLFSPAFHPLEALLLGAGAVTGSLLGHAGLRRLDDKKLRWGVVGLGLALTLGLFLRSG